MSAVTDGPHIMVLGTGEIARCIVAQAHAAGYAVTVCNPRAAGIDQHAGAVTAGTQAAGVGHRDLS